MTATIENITVEAGASFDWTFTHATAAGVAISNAGGSATMQARATPDHGTKKIDLTSAGGDITLGGSNGSVRVQMTAAATAALTASTGLPWTGVYDVLVTVGSTVYRAREGSCIVTPAVTR